VKWAKGEKFAGCCCQMGQRQRKLGLRPCIVSPRLCLIAMDAGPGAEVVGHMPPCGGELKKCSNTDKQ
jgi:hypothetical protein